MSSIMDCILEQVSFEGRQYPDQKWFLSDYDTWHRNPHWVNKKPWLIDDSHPEDVQELPVKLRVIQCKYSNFWHGDALKKKSLDDGELNF